MQPSSANGGVEAASGDAKQRKRTNCCVPKAQGESLKGVLPRSSGEVGIAPGGWRADCLRSWQKPNADNPHQNVNYVLKFHVYFPLSVCPRWVDPSQCRSEKGEESSGRNAFCPDPGFQRTP